MQTPDFHADDEFRDDRVVIFVDSREVVPLIGKEGLPHPHWNRGIVVTEDVAARLASATLGLVGWAFLRDWETRKV